MKYTKYYWPDGVSVLGHQVTEQELLWYAAKAVHDLDNTLAGFALDTSRGMRLVNFETREFVRFWNPLTDDGDALRLAVRLHLFQNSLFNATVSSETLKCGSWEVATRVTIVQLAAEIGRNMQ